MYSIPLRFGIGRTPVLSAKDDDYGMKQCLVRSQEFPQKFDTVWIPEEFAVTGKDIEIKKEDTWVPFKVVQAYEHQQKYSSVRERSQDYKRTRKASDI